MGTGDARIFWRPATSLLAGRVLGEQDSASSPHVAVVNMSFVRKFFGTPGQALGKSFGERRTKDKDPLLIVGIVKDAKHFSLHDDPKPIFYSPIFQQKEPVSVSVYVRTGQEPEAAGSAIRAAVSSIDSKLVVDSLQSMQTQIDETLTSEGRFRFWRPVLESSPSLLQPLACMECWPTPLPSARERSASAWRLARAGVRW